MEEKIHTLHLEDNVEHQVSLEASDASDNMDDYQPPCIGSAHQAEIPNLVTEDERCQLMASPLYSCMLLVNDSPSLVGLAIPIIWVSHPPSEVDANKDKSQTIHSLESESRMGYRYMDIQGTSVCSNCNITSDCDSTCLNSHAVLPVDQTESVSNQVYDEKSSSYFSQEYLTDMPTVEQRETEQFASLPGLSASVWNDLEEECFLVGLHIFGKNFSLVSKFVGSKPVGDMLSYYYGKFYKSDAYKRYVRWPQRRKKKKTKRNLGKSIFTGRRQQELLSCLKSKIPNDALHSLVEALKSCNDRRASLDEYVFTLKSTIGPETFVEVIRIGKGEYDLTGFVQGTSKTNQVRSVPSNTSKDMNCSTLATEDIVKFLTGDFRKSKSKLDELFWEAIWPRLLARGWHSEQPKDVRTTKNCLVFVVPGIKNFSRKELTKGTNYFDSVTDVLKQVTEDPTLLDIDINGIENGAAVHKNVHETGQDGPLDCDQEFLMFTIVDTSLVPGEEPFNVRELRSLPADANISFGPSYHSDDMLSVSSLQKLDADDRSSDYQEDCGRMTTHENDIEMLSIYNKIKEPRVDLLENMGTAPCSVFPVNGHSSDDQRSDISNGNGDKIDLSCFSGLGTKIGRRVYLSPKRRRVARCSNDQTSRQGYSFSNNDGLEKQKLKPLRTSSKPTIVDLGSSFQTRTLAKCSSTKEKPREEIANVVKSTANGGPHQNSNTASINEAKLLERNVGTAKIQPKIKISRTNLAIEGAQAGLSIDLNKVPTSADHEVSMMTSSENQGCLLASEHVAPSISNNETVPDVLETAATPDRAAVQPIMRYGTRNRPPTAKVLEAVAFGLLGGAKRKGDPKSLKTIRPPHRARKNKD